MSEVGESVELSEQKREAIRDLLRIQGANGNYNADPYMLGMYNGMELIAAMVEDREPTYKEAEFGERELSEYEQLLVVSALTEVAEGYGADISELFTPEQRSSIVNIAEKYDIPFGQQVSDVNRILGEMVTVLLAENERPVVASEGADADDEG